MPIELKDISYTYMPGTPYERKALRHVSLTIADGTFVAIAGHTGSGKSTLLQHLNGLLTPTTGQVFVDGVDLSPKQRSEKLAALAARRSVGMVFQYAENQLFEETIYEDIAFGPRNFGCGEAEIDQRVRAAMALVNLDFETYKDRSPFQLSGGQMRRVALAGVLALQPKYLVLDEPTAGLDPKGRKALLQVIRELHKNAGTTIIFVSHNMDDIFALADEVVVMKQGELLLSGTPAEVFPQTERIAEAGLRPPQLMALLSRVQAAGVALSAEDLLSRTPAEAARAIGRALAEAQKGGRNRAE
ncbi:energy-coupling factor transporter ATPase [Selenomonas sp.]|uniref:energy-coupling factor transporter ATPase n=1 Tax=Selenomonas sp. TaxID=2053611 RepID=UPI002A810AD3|nr:energy-coupling factor transporter ATPase [Selenomonas sp.]MDY4415647.1 energy-coupling factor transporter ATPase [Selenomonas sp.]